MKPIVAVIALFMMIALTPVFADETDLKSSGCWEVAGAAKSVTWVEVHSFEQMNGQEIAHMEMMTRKKRSKPWEFTVLLPHLAISVEALKRSVLRPLKTGSVYPETYFGGYEQWKHEVEQGKINVCTTSIADALVAPK